MKTKVYASRGCCRYAQSLHFAVCEAKAEAAGWTGACDRWPRGMQKTETEIMVERTSH